MKTSIQMRSRWRWCSALVIALALVLATIQMAQQTSNSADLWREAPAIADPQTGLGSGGG